MHREPIRARLAPDCVIALGAGLVPARSLATIARSLAITRAGTRPVPRVILLACLTIALSLAACGSRPPARPGPLTSVRTLVAPEKSADIARFSNPFGITVATDGTIFYTDGALDSLFQLGTDGSKRLITDRLNTPSAVAITQDGSLVVADTGSHTIKRIEAASGGVKIIAGIEGRAGFADGDGVVALFNGPIGVAVAADGRILVADTYNDRIRVIDTQGTVHTLAGGGEPGFMDARVGTEARFHTPCGLAVASDGAVIVADTGNHRLRRIGTDGSVTTLAGTGEAGSSDGLLSTARFDEPTGVAVGGDGTIYIAEAGSSVLRACTFRFIPQVITLAGGRLGGHADGPLADARFNHPSGIAIAPEETLVVADSGNGAVRYLTRAGETAERGRVLTKEEAQSLRPTAAEFRSQGTARWPYEPPARPREIAATFGEVRGEVADGKDAWFHNGLDIPGAYGETVRLVRDERVLDPLPVADTGTARERIRFPSLGYVHLRLGRNRDDEPFDDERFHLLLDGERHVRDVRVRRGERFKAGDALGTLNNQYHVHLIAGPVGAEFNALAALELPGIKDTVAPTIERDGIELFSRDGERLGGSSSAGEGRARRAGESVVKVNEAAKRAGDSSGSEESGAAVTVGGDVRIVLRAYDQMDGNAARRRLGLYRLGYQILTRDGRPVPGFNEPVATISFESLPDDPFTVRLAYAPGSQSGYTPQTVFAYILTDRVRDRLAVEDYWHASSLAPGDYVVRVFAEDFFGNRTTRDVPVRIAS